MTTNPIDRPRPDWVLVANAARARCFERDPEDGTLHELADFVHPQSRMKASPPPHAFKGHASTQFEPRTDTQTKEHAAFAHEVAAFLEEAARVQRYGQLTLLASSAFLGTLRSHLAPLARALVQASIALDLSASRGKELEDRVTSAIRAA